MHLENVSNRVGMTAFPRHARPWWHSARLPRCVLLILAVTFANVLSRGAAPFEPVRGNPLLEKWRWTHITEMDGKGFACMTENKDGLWFGTLKGVVFYDGRKWTNYTSNDGLFFAQVSSLSATRDGTIWAGAAAAVSNNLCYLSDGKWHSILGGNSVPVAAADIVEAADGSIWTTLVYSPSSTNYLFSTTNQSVILRFKTNTITLFGDPDSPLAKAIPEARFVALPSQLAREAWAFVFEDRDGRLWFAPDHGGILACWDPRKGSMDATNAWQTCEDGKGFAIRYNPVLMQRNDGRMLLGFGDGAKDLWGLDSKSNRWSVELPDIGRVDCMQETRDGTLLVSSHGDIWERQRKSWHSFEAGTLGLSPGTLQIFEAANGDLWLGTFNGNVFRVDYTDRRWISYDGLNFQGNDVSGAEWFLHVDGSVVCHNGKKWTRFDSNDGVIGHPVALHCAKDGTVWVAGSHEGVAATAYFENGQWHRQPHPDLSWTVDYRSVLEKLDGSLWFGANSEPVPGRSFNGGIACFNKSAPGTNQWSRLYSPQVPKAVCGMTQLPDGRIYYGGWCVAEQRKDSWVILTNMWGLESYWIDAVAASPAGDLWAAHGGMGVFWRHDGIWKKFDATSGLADLMVSTLLCAQDGTVWAGTPKGISHFDGRSWTPRPFATEAIAIDREGGTLRESRDGRVWVNSAPRKWYFRAQTGNDFTAATLPSFRTIGYLGGHLTPHTKLKVFSPKVSQPIRMFAARRRCARLPAETTTEEFTQWYEEE